ncbi:MAG: hypothetical protein AAGE03_03550 [Pseudomonadota bacterium]
MEKPLTMKEACRAMFAYLSKWYDTTGSDEIGALLGSMSLVEDDDRPADPAIWSDWLECVAAAKSGKVDASLQLLAEESDGEPSASR